MPSDSQKSADLRKEIGRAVVLAISDPSRTIVGGLVDLILEHLALEAERTDGVYGRLQAKSDRAAELRSLKRG